MLHFCPLFLLQSEFANCLNLVCHSSFLLCYAYKIFSLEVPQHKKAFIKLVDNDEWRKKQNKTESYISSNDVYKQYIKTGQNNNILGH